LQTALDCYPCFFRQALQAAREVTGDPAVHGRVMRRISEACATLDLNLSPPVVGQRIHRIIRQVTGHDDPYHQIKQRFNAHAVELRDRLRPRVVESADPLDSALRLAIAGNRIDFGACSGVSEQDVSALTERAFEQPMNGQLDALKRDLAGARRVLFLADNAGEIALDMLLIEQLSSDKVTVVVRGAPVLNDATMADAEAVGLTDLVTVMDNGSDAPGTLLDDCSPAFRTAFDASDLILSKGQGNYESLSELNDRNIYYLLIPKCALVAGHLGCDEGSFVLARSAKEMIP
jgi:uncharacterized protein with ATP-grasp and redox domains